MKIAAIALLALIGLTIAFVFWTKSAPAVTRAMVTQQGSAAPGSLDEKVEQAIANGQDLIMSPILVRHEAVEGFDEAQTYYTIVVVKALSSQSLAISPYNIETWFRFELQEVLSAQPPHLCVNSACAFPAGVAAPAGNEILVPRAGGIIVRNGVTIDMRWSEFPDFTVGQTYLLFIDYDATARIGVPAIGPVGVFLVNAYGTLTPILPEETGLREDVAARFGNSLHQLRAALNPPTSSCDPIQEQNCYNQGGSWDPSMCYCSGGSPCTDVPWGMNCY